MTDEHEKPGPPLTTDAGATAPDGSPGRDPAEPPRAEPAQIPRHVLDLPKIEPVRRPSHREANEFQSAGVLVKRLAQAVMQWRQQLPADSQPIVLALLPHGDQIDVSLLAEESFHGLRIEGTMNGTPCMLLTHQASVQLLCRVARVEDASPRRCIAFIIDGTEIQA